MSGFLPILKKDFSLFITFMLYCSKNSINNVELIRNLMFRLEMFLKEKFFNKIIYYENFLIINFIK